MENLKIGLALITVVVGPIVFIYCLATSLIDIARSLCCC